MPQYYFEIAYLPHLTYDAEAFMTLDSFRELCRERCTKHHFSIIENTNIFNYEEEKPSCESHKKWIEREVYLRNTLVNLRAAKKGIDPVEYIKDTPEYEDIMDIQNITQEAFGQDSPLEAEDILNQARWDFLDEIEKYHYFDIEKMVIYYLKLQILNRKNTFDHDIGKANFEKLLEQSVSDEAEAAVEEGETDE